MWNNRSKRFMVVSPIGTTYYGRRDPRTGHFIPAGNDIKYVFGKLNAASETVSLLAFDELIKMSQAFLNSYQGGESGNFSLPRDTGNLIDSTSIIVAKGTKTGQGQNMQRAIHLSKIATVEQHWGNWSKYGVEKGHGQGTSYRLEDITELMDVKTLSELAVALRVGIPYALPINEEGTRSGQHRGFFNAFAEDFKYNVMEISKKVADTLKYSEGDLTIAGKTNLGKRSV